MSTSWCLVPSNRCGVVFKTHTSYLFNKLYPIAWWKSCASTKSFSIQNTFIFNSRNCHLKRKKSRRNEKKKSNVENTRNTRIHFVNMQPHSHNHMKLSEEQSSKNVTYFALAWLELWAWDGKHINESVSQRNAMTCMRMCLIFVEWFNLWWMLNLW